MSVGSINFCRAEDLMDVKVSIDFLKRIAENAEILRDHFSTLPIESYRSWHLPMFTKLYGYINKNCWI